MKWRGRLCPLHFYLPPGFSDLPTALPCDPCVICRTSTTTNVKNAKRKLNFLGNWIFQQKKILLSPLPYFTSFAFVKFLCNISYSDFKDRFSSSPHRKYSPPPLDTILVSIDIWKAKRYFRLNYFWSYLLCKLLHNKSKRILNCPSFPCIGFFFFLL